jgi:hypothetical protein
MSDLSGREKATADALSAAPSASRGILDPVEVLRALQDWIKAQGTEFANQYYAPSEREASEAIDAVLSIAEDASQASALLDGHDSPVVMKNTLANRVRELKARLAEAERRAEYEIGVWREKEKHQHNCAVRAAGQVMRAEAREKALREAARPFLPGARQWGKVLAWVVAGAPACGATREEGIAAAAQINEWRCALDDAARAALAKVTP